MQTLFTPVAMGGGRRANAQRTRSQFLTAEPLIVDGIRGVHMEAPAEMGGTVYFVTRWLGRGDRMLKPFFRAEEVPTIGALMAQ